MRRQLSHLDQKLLLGDGMAAQWAGPSNNQENASQTKLIYAPSQVRLPFQVSQVSQFDRDLGENRD